MPSCGVCLSVCPSVRVSVTFVSCVKKNKVTRSYEKLGVFDKYLIQICYFLQENKSGCFFWTQSILIWFTNLDTSYCIRNKDSKHTIQKVDSIKDLGILFDTRLNFKDHIQEKINKAYNMIRLLKRNFIHVDCNTFILLYKALVRPHVEYANSVWSP